VILLNGKKLAEEISERLKREIKKRRLKLKLAVILIGDNHVSKIFAREKERVARKIGIGFKLFYFSAGINQLELKKQIKKITRNKNITGILIEFPLSKNFNTQEILNLIPSAKNVEFFSPVVCAISHLLKGYKIPFKGKNIVIVGAGRLVGRPLSLWLSRKKIKFLIVDKFTKNIPSLTKKADILISGTGSPNLIKSNMIKRGAVVIDVGSCFKSGKIIGDVDFKDVSKKASYITPIAGGIGPLTVACLFENLVKLKRK